MDRNGIFIEMKTSIGKCSEKEALSKHSCELVYY